MPDDSCKPVRPAPKHRSGGSPSAFRRNAPSHGLSGSLSSAALPALRTSDPYSNRNRCYHITDASPCQRPAAEVQGKDRGGLHRRLPVILRTMPPMNFGSRMHIMRTRIFSPPAGIDQRPPGAHQRSSGQRRPRPPRDAQKQQQQSGADEQAPQQLPNAILLGTLGRTLLTGLITDLSHRCSPRFTASICRGGIRGCTFLYETGKKFEMMTFLLHSAFTIGRKSCKIEGVFAHRAHYAFHDHRNRRTLCQR